MNRMSALHWISYREIRPLLFMGFGIFFVLPCVINMGDYIYYLRLDYRMHSYPGLTINLMSGALFSIIIAAALFCPDMQSKLNIFCGSRPIGLSQFVGTKFRVGLLAVLIIPALSIVMDIVWLFTTEPSSHYYMYLYQVLICHSAVLVLIYSLSFFSACLLRNTVEATLVSVGLALLIYLLPIVISLFNSVGFVNLMMNFGWYKFSPAIFLFVVKMTVGSLLAYFLAYQVLKRNLYRNLKQQSIVWCVGLVFILLITSGFYQVGSNLDCEQLIKWKGVERSITNIVVHDDRILVGYQLDPHNYSSAVQETGIEILSYQTSGIIVEDSTKMDSIGVSCAGYDDSQLIWPLSTPEYAYTLQDVVEGTNRYMSKRTQMNFCTIDLNQASGPAIINRLDLLPLFPTAVKTDHVRPSIYVGTKAHIFNGEGNLATINLSDPTKPFIESTTHTIGISDLCPMFPESEQMYEVRLPDIPGLLPQERLAVVLDLDIEINRQHMDENIWPMCQRGVLKIYQLISLTEGKAVLKLMSQLSRIPIEQIMNVNYSDLLVYNGFCYMLRNNGVSVFDIRDPEHPKRAGHYNAPDEVFHAIAPLRNGRVLLGGNNLHVIAPPR